MTLDTMSASIENILAVNEVNAAAGKRRAEMALPQYEANLKQAGKDLRVLKAIIAGTFDPKMLDEKEPVTA